MSFVSHELRGQAVNLVHALKRYATVVADTSDFQSIARCKPQYEHLIEHAIRHSGRIAGRPAARSGGFMDKMLVNIGCEILKIVPGWVSTDVDGRLSFDVEATLAKAGVLIEMYAKAGIGREWVLSVHRTGDLCARD